MRSNLIIISVILGVLGSSFAWAEELPKKSWSDFPDFSYAGYHQGDVPLPQLKAEVSVLDFGAKGDGKTDSTEAFKHALKEAAGKVIAVPKGTYILSDRLKIDLSNTVLLGAGAGETFLNFTRSLEEIEPRLTRNGGGTKTTAWSWSGGLISVGSSARKPSAEVGVTKLASKGTREIWVKDGALFKAGDDCSVAVSDTPKLTLLNYVYAGNPGNISHIKNRKFAISQPVTVVRVQGNKLTLKQALRFDLRFEWLPTIEKLNMKN